MDSLWIELLLIVVAILLNGFFAGSEIALVSSRVSRLSHLRDQGIPGAEPALGLKESPEAFLATIQIAITLVGALASAVGGTAAVERLTPWLIGLPIPDAATWAEPVALGLAIIAITYFSLVIGELTPKALAAPSLHLLRGRLPSVVRGLRRYYGPVRLPVVVHQRRVSLDFPVRPRTPSVLGNHEFSRFSREVFPHMPGVSDRAELRRVLPWRRAGYSLPLLLTASALRSTFLSRLNTRPARTPVNASRTAAHDSGPAWAANPSPYDSFIRNTSPV